MTGKINQLKCLKHSFQINILSSLGTGFTMCPGLPQTVQSQGTQHLFLYIVQICPYDPMLQGFYLCGLSMLINEFPKIYKYIWSYTMFDYQNFMTSQCQVSNSLVVTFQKCQYHVIRIALQGISPQLNCSEAPYTGKSSSDQFLT